MSGHYLSCTTLLRDENMLTDWRLLTMPENMSKFHLDDVYNSVSDILYTNRLHDFIAQLIVLRFLQS